MSFALGDFDIGFLLLNDSDELLFDDPVILNANQRQLSYPAHMRIMNESSKGLLVTTLTSGDSFWLRAGDSTVIRLTPGERGISYLCQYIISGATSINKLWCTYFGPGEEVYPLESCSNQARNS